MWSQLELGKYIDIIVKPIITIIDTFLMLKYSGGQYCHYHHKFERSSYIIWDVFTQGVSDLLGSAPFCTSLVLFQ